MSPIAGTVNRDEYITIIQDCKGRRELTQSSSPKVDVYYTYRLAAGHAHASMSQGTSEAWHPRVNYELLLK